MHFLAEYSLFFAKIATFVVAIILLIAALVAIGTKGRDKSKGKIKVNKLNDKYETMSNSLKEAVLTKAEQKEYKKQEKLKNKLKKKSESSAALSRKKRRIFVIHFQGDIKASAVNQLREEITAILTIATPADEVLALIESSGGLVHSYGLAASQLKRLRDQGIPLTVAIDKVAASGGYLMACVANKIIAAPFAIIGSIGVIAQLPNLHDFLKKKHIDFEQITAGEYKRTLTVFGKNTSKGREKMQEEVNAVHDLFKQFITENRSWIDINKVATGEHWQARRALELHLVDELKTSDDYLLSASQNADIYEVKQQRKKTLTQKMGTAAEDCLFNLLVRWEKFLV